LKEIILALGQRDDLTDWENTFLGSLGLFLERRGHLTEGQRTVLGKIQHKYNEENMAKRDAWAENFTLEMRHDMVVMAHYYSHNPPYFQKLAYEVLHGSETLPGEKAYRSMCENKYARRVLETYHSEPQYPVGTLAMMRETQQVREEHKGKTVFIVSHGEWVTTAAAGAKTVTVLPVGSNETMITEERWLKKLPKSPS
jgi:hypothetical protein